MTAVSGVVTISVKPGAKAPGIFLGSDGAITVRVRERAMEGRANEAVRDALAGALGLPKSTLTLIRGAKSRQKTFAITGISSIDARHRLQERGE